MKTLLRTATLLAFTLGCAQTPVVSPPPSESESRYQPVIARVGHGMVVSDDAVASECGAEILRRGGNAIDAAVATAFALSVTRPHFASLGGGGFLLYCPQRKPCTVIDYREVAPARATRTMYIKDGKADTNLSQNGALAVATPGVTAGLLMALEKFGTLPRQALLRRPIEIARQGFAFTGYMENAARDRWEDMNSDARRIVSSCGQDPKKICEPGETLRQPELARVLESISKDGRRGFYQGWVGQKITQGIRQSGGILSEEDLRNYQPKQRTPLSGRYQNQEVVVMPPPSAGGVGILQMFAYLDLADQEGALKGGYGSARTIHALAHGMSLAFSDRADFFGDPDLTDIPVQKLLDPVELKKKWDGSYSPTRMNSLPEGQHTTHFSVVDRHGNAVAITTTVNDNYGSGFVAPGTGVFLNNEMDDFSLQPGVPNLFGLVAKSEVNAVGPRKRPLSSMAPTIIRNLDQTNRLVIGAAGGPKIPTSIFLSLANRLRFGMSLPDAVSASRFHHQWRPSQLFLEQNGFSLETKKELESYGYALREIAVSGRIHALEIRPDGRVWGAADRRGEGAAVAE